MHIASAPLSLAGKRRVFFSCVSSEVGRAASVSSSKKRAQCVPYIQLSRAARKLHVRQSERFAQLEDRVQTLDLSSVLRLPLPERGGCGSGTVGSTG